MSQFNIYLGNPTKLTYRWKDLVTAVQGILKPAMPANPPRNLYVQSTMSAPLMLQGEILVYMLESPARSVIAGPFGIDVDSNRAGFTVERDDLGVASEVYMKAAHSLGELARVVCHEIIHNKVPEHSDKIHALGGLSGSKPGEPTPKDYDLLRRHLTKPRRQWLGGFRGRT